MLGSRRGSALRKDGSCVGRNSRRKVSSDVPLSRCAWQPAELRGHSGLTDTEAPLRRCPNSLPSVGWLAAQHRWPALCARGPACETPGLPSCACGFRGPASPRAATQSLCHGHSHWCPTPLSRELSSLPPFLPCVVLLS